MIFFIYHPRFLPFVSVVQSRIKTVEKMDAEAPPPVVQDAVWRFSIPNSEPVSRPIIQINDVTFDYSPIREDGSKKPLADYLLQDVNFGVDLDSKIAILGTYRFQILSVLTLFGFLPSPVQILPISHPFPPPYRPSFFKVPTDRAKPRFLISSWGKSNPFPEIYPLIPD